MTSKQTAIKEINAIEEKLFLPKSKNLQNKSLFDLWEIQEELELKLHAMIIEINK